MPIKNPRINVTFEESTVEFLTDFAKQEDKSVSSLVNKLILEALGHREDVALSAIAEIRDVQDIKKIKHEDAWK